MTKYGLTAKIYDKDNARVKSVCFPGFGRGYAISGSLILYREFLA